MKTSSSELQQLPKAPPPKTITLGTGFQHMSLKGASINIQTITCRFINAELTAKGTHARVDLIEQVFSQQDTLQLRTALQHYIWRPFSAVKSPTNGTKNAKKETWNKLQKGHLFTVWELKEECRAQFCSTLAGNMGCQATQIFHSSEHFCEWLMKTSLVLIFKLQITFSE